MKLCQKSYFGWKFQQVGGCCTCIVGSRFYLWFRISEFQLEYGRLQSCINLPYWMTSNSKWACVRFTALKGPMANRRQRLEDSLRWHQYNFDSNTELQWIEEHMLAATSTDYGKSLVDAQNLYAKHKVIYQVVNFCLSLYKYNVIWKQLAT